MGTNYYLRKAVCSKCGRCSQEEHIGKSSAGWTFTFHATYNIKSEKGWREATKSGQIYDEYNRKITYKKFWEHVDSKRNEPNNHAKFSKEGRSYLDNEGNSFSPYDFS